MSNVLCPECKEAVRVPPECERADQLRCPWCHEEFSAAAVLEQLPPLLVIVSQDQDTVAEGAEEAAGQGWEQLASLAESSEDDESESEPFELGASGAVNSAAGLHRMTRASSRNSAVELAKIAAGGALAVPIALFILLWLGRDVLHIGPTIGAYLPWAVPARYRPDGEADTEARPASPAAARDSSASVFRDGKVVSPPPVPDDPDRLTSGTGRQDGSKRVGSEGARDGEALPAAVAAKASDEATRGSRMPVSGVRDAPVITAGGFSDSVEQAERAWEAWREAVAGKDTMMEQQQRTSLLRQLAAVGESAVFVESAPDRLGPIADRALKLMERIGAEPDLLPRIGNTARARWESSERPIRGVIVFGTAGGVTRQGGYFAVELTLAAKEKTKIEMLSVTDPGETFQKGDGILVLGVIVDRPAELLVGYTGKANRVLVGALPYRILQGSK